MFASCFFWSLGDAVAHVAVVIMGIDVTRSIYCGNGS